MANVTTSCDYSTTLILCHDLIFHQLMLHTCYMMQGVTHVWYAHVMSFAGKRHPMYRKTGSHSSVCEMLKGKLQVNITKRMDNNHRTNEGVVSMVTNNTTGWREGDKEARTGNEEDWESTGTQNEASTLGRKRKKSRGVKVHLCVSVKVLSMVMSVPCYVWWESSQRLCSQPWKQFCFYMPSV